MNPHLVNPDPAADPGSLPGEVPGPEARASLPLPENAETEFSSLASALDLTSMCEDELDPALAELVEQVTRAVQAGEPVDIDELAACMPANAETLRRLLPALRQLARLGSGAGGATGPPRTRHPGSDRTRTTTR
jgi:hypothetical protein